MPEAVGSTLPQNVPGFSATSAPPGSGSDHGSAVNGPAQGVTAVPQPGASRLLQAALLAGAGLTLALAYAAKRPVPGFAGWLLPMAQLLLLATSVGLVVAGIAARSPEGVAELAERWHMATRREALYALGTTVLQLGLLWLLFVRFKLENEAFYEKIAVLAFGGFVVHYFLPARHRMPYFLGLSLIGIATVLGLQNGAWLVAVGLLLIGICHLPVRYAARVALLLAAGAFLAFGRVDGIGMPWSRAVWPILGSMFMFRLIVYLYDTEHAKQRPTFVSSLSYFFLLPNVVFPFFPVVDYTAFRRMYYDEGEFAIYQRGVRWMVRGALQLIAYRFVYHYLAIPTTAVHTVADLAQYMVATFMLYIRVSGQFHLVTGMLHLFGFNLPPTHNRYFLSSSITDFWRRINIYWKDFMLKLVFYPAYFRLKKRGETTALVLGMVIVFIVTWMLHSYQWFWLLGEFPLNANDGIFWGLLGAVMIANTLYERKYSRKRQLQPATVSFRTHLPVALKTIGTFVFICVLWSFWTVPSIKDWIALVTLN